MLYLIGKKQTQQSNKSFKENRINGYRKDKKWQVMTRLFLYCGYIYNHKTLVIIYNLIHTLKYSERRVPGEQTRKGYKN